MKLVDSFGRFHNYLRISLTERCNLRCLYCMPAEGVPLQPNDRLLTREEIFQLASKFVDSGVDKIRLTGGEPTVRKDFMDIVKDLGAMDGLNQLAITTNGIALPRKLPTLKEYGLTGVNISLDTLVEAKFNFFTRRRGISRVLDAIHKSIEVGIPKVKVNCVVMRNQNEDEIIDFVKMTEHLPIQVRFIEYMPFDGNRWQQRKMLSYIEMIDKLQTEGGFKLTRQIENQAGETSKNYSITGPNGQTHAGSVGFITSMTSNFCGTCNRMRISADGNLKVCLFGNEEVSLRDMLRNGSSDEDIQTIVEMALYNKKKEHAGMEELRDMKNRPMILIGGKRNMNRSNIRRSMPQIRAYSTSTKLTHVDEDGSAHMVDVGMKNPTKRSATAIGRIYFSNTIPSQQIQENSNKKGDVLGVARIAGIMAAKQTSNLIPLCHPIAISKIKNNLSLSTGEEKADGRTFVDVETTVQCNGPTGVEMEALVGANITLTTIYDMCKAVDKHMEITGVKVVQKQGGKHDFDIKKA